ncbi:MAG: cohesin domain-containing protein [Patescibacteria group bacterium]|nr:cohesin domain-containing protein [Patescibacteria group bacterium]
MKKKIFFSILIGVFLVLGIGSHVSAQGGSATLFLSPGSGSYSLGKSFSVKIAVDSGGGLGINAAEGQIKFDPEYLTISGISDASTIFKLWTTEPTYSNSAGTISFGGGSPGTYKGSSGEIFRVTFKAKKAGETEVKWNSGVVLAADGRGTNVFGGFGNAKYTINETVASEERKPKVEEEEEKKPKGNLSPQPDISSKTHLDEDKWYSDNNPEFNWRILSDMTGVSYDISDEAGADPGPENDGLVETALFNDVEDGEWYFHLKYQNQFGWGKTSHYKLKIDNTPPEAFNVKVDNNQDSTNPIPKLIFKTTDKVSGLSHYQILLGMNNIKVEISEMDRGYYQLQPLAPGEYRLDVAAIDNAGNTASSTLMFTIDPLKSPIITSIPKIYSTKDDLIIRGTSFYPNVTVKIYIGTDGADTEEFEVSTDNEGNWSFFHNGGIDKGVYEVWAKLIDERGAESMDSSHHILTVISPSILDSFCGLILILLLLIIVGLILYILYQRKLNITEKARIFKETDEVKIKLAKIFSALREEVDELIALADKRPGLSESERRIKEKMQESLDISEEFISKEVEDVEKEIKIKKKKSS